MRYMYILRLNKVSSKKLCYYWTKILIICWGKLKNLKRKFVINIIHQTFCVQNFRFDCRQSSILQTFRILSNNISFQVTIHLSFTITTLYINGVQKRIFALNIKKSEWSNHQKFNSDMLKSELSKQGLTLNGKKRIYQEGVL